MIDDATYGNESLDGALRPRPPVQSRDHPTAQEAQSQWTTMLYFVLFILTLIIFGRCTNPIDDNHIVDPIDVTPDPDDPRFDTMYARIGTTIRFEAVIDRAHYPFQRITDSMRIAIVGEMPKDSLEPFREIYSASALYLNAGTVALPFDAAIPPNYFFRWNNARLFIGYVVLFVDRNKNKRYDFGEPVYGGGEQSVFGFAEGKKLSNIPRHLRDGLITGFNAMIRTGWIQYASEFKAAPDFYATIFRITVKGTKYHYGIPYPWKPSAELQP